MLFAICRGRLVGRSVTLLLLVCKLSLYGLVLFHKYSNKRNFFQNLQYKPKLCGSLFFPLTPSMSFSPPLSQKVIQYSNINEQIKIIIGVVVALALVCLFVAVFVFCRSAKSKRANRGTYSPSNQEIIGSRVEMGNILKPPPEERLIWDSRASDSPSSSLPSPPSHTHINLTSWSPTLSKEDKLKEYEWRIKHAASSRIVQSHRASTSSQPASAWFFLSILQLFSSLPHTYKKKESCLAT